MGLRTKRKFFSKTSKSLILTVCLCMALLMTAMPSEVYADNDQRSTGTHANLVLFAYFADESEPDWFNAVSEGGYTDSFTQGMTNVQRYMNYYDGSGDDEQKRYFKYYMSAISGGKHQILNVFPQYDSNRQRVQPVKLSITEQQAKTGNYDTQILADLRNAVDLSAWKDQLDLNKDGIIDNVTVILQGDNAKGSNGQEPSLRSHKFTYSAINWGSTGLDTSTFNMLNTDTLNTKRAGLIAHEYLHSLNYPDLYRTDGDKNRPVGNWDIMSGDGRFMTYPLAYLRMAVSNWVQIPEITDAATGNSNPDGTTKYSLTLETISDINLCNAVMITSPLNPYEKFVIEVREQPADYYSGQSLDGGIPASGVIVYRVDTTVDGYSNYYGKTGVYVFGKETTGDRADAALNAGNQSYGSNNVNDTANAITFSDGTNTGIVVSNVSDIQSGKVTLDVTLPDWSAFDKWNTSHEFDASETLSLMSFNDKQIAAVQSNQSKDTVNFYEYANNSWSSSTELGALQADVDIEKIKLVTFDDTIFAAYVDINGDGHVKVLEQGQWNEVEDIDGNGIGSVSSWDLDIGTAGDSLYISYLFGNSTNATVNVREITANGTDVKLGVPMTVATGDIGNSRVLEQQDSLVISYKEIGSSEIQIKKYDGSGGFPEGIVGPGAADSYDIITYNQELYFASASVNDLKVSKYDIQQGKWLDYANGSIDSYDPKLAVAQGNLYVVIGPASSGKNGVYAYEVTASELVEEGLAVDSGVKGSGYSMIASGDRLFVGYTDGNKAYIKEKAISNSLLSLTITPPDKVSYIVGDTMDLAGLKVVANYQKETRELAPGEYKVEGFGTEENGSLVARTTGSHIANVIFATDTSISNTFSYMISDVPVTASVTSVRNGADESTQFTYGDVVDVTVETSGAAGKQIALYYRQADGTLSKLTEPIEVTEDKAYQLSYDTKGKLLPTGDALSLAVCFVDGDVITSVDSVDIALSERTLTASIAGTLSKTYDGTTNAPDAQIELSGVVGGEASAAGTVVYDSPTAGERTLSVEDFNVNFSSGAESYYAVPDAPTAAGTIAKADAPMSAGGQLKVTNNYAQTYQYDLSRLLPALESGCEWGNLTYTLGTVSLGEYYTDGAQISSAGVLSLPVNKVDTTVEGDIGTVAVTVTSDNYEQFTAELKVSATQDMQGGGDPEQPGGGDPEQPGGGDTPDFRPVITDGANGVWKKESGEGLSFRSDAEYADFVKVQVDGRDVDATNYEVREGSTIVTLKASYLETLSGGVHTLAIVSQTGTAETTFTIQQGEGGSSGQEQPSDQNGNTPQGGSGSETPKTESGTSQSGSDTTKTSGKAAGTGDDSRAALWGILALLASVCSAKIVLMRRRKIR